MLELKRKVEQQVLIGERVTLTVKKLVDPIVEMQFHSTVGLFYAKVAKGERYGLKVRGQVIFVHVLDIGRGEASLGFDAPREVAIDRIEATTTDSGE